MCSGREQGSAYPLQSSTTSPAVECDRLGRGCESAGDGGRGVVAEQRGSSGRYLQDGEGAWFVVGPDGWPEAIDAWAAAEVGCADEDLPTEMGTPDASFVGDAPPPAGQDEGWQGGQEH